jgi:hypothetical protein
LKSLTPLPGFHVVVFSDGCPRPLNGNFSTSIVGVFASS